MITLKNVTGGYNASTAIVKDLSFTVEKGCFFALLGPNGSGKTTIVRLIMGALHLHRGSVAIDGKEVKEFKPRELAQKVAVMTQENEIGLDFTVKEIVSLGRYPYQKSLFLKENTKRDEEVIKHVMEQTKVWEFRHKIFGNLSGGEKQRVLLAKALAQEPKLLLLDEPTNHLDVRHSMELLDLLKNLQLKMNLTVFAILHDLNIASLYADSIALLNEGQLQGIYNGLLDENQEEFSDVYQVRMNFHPHPEVAKNQILISPDFLLENRSDIIRNKVFVEIQQERKKITFHKPLRTLSIGAKGSGLTWMKGWTNQYKEDNHENAVLVGDIYAYAYNKQNESCEKWELEGEIKSDWTSLICLAKSHQEYHIAFVTNHAFNDVQLMNQAARIVALKTKLDVDNTNSFDTAMPLLSISTCSSERYDEENGNELLRLFQYAWNRTREASNNCTKYEVKMN
ncbi:MULTISPECIES: ABC transporter ATP-binding protein [Bacillus]|uniref:ABC transporter ATP-binding protein n=1 Tax=Bacillus TaxID=1386 RepID=UPI0002DCB84B|nr:MULTISPECIES: ABC transporter ATP-binding protein [Bacillus]